MHDLVIIGAGAAGLMASASAAQRGLDVLLIEKNKKLGVKILMSGGTRCNITHNCSVQEVVKAYGRQGKFLHSPLASLPPSEVVKIVESNGVPTKVESTGKVFPVSNKAIDVRDALVRFAEASGAKILNPLPVTRLEKTENHFSVITEKGSFQARAVLITTGGKSYPGCGTTGDGYQWAMDFGHSIVPTVPALVPILSNTQWANELKGITIPKAHVQIHELKAPKAGDATSKPRKPKILAKREGSFLFTHWGFSGPSILDVSREVARHERAKELKLVCDFVPDVSSNDLIAFIQSQKKNSGKQQTSGLLTDYFPRRMSDAILAEAGVLPQAKIAELSNSGIENIRLSLKQATFSINGTLGFEKAEVTAGGVSLKEVDSKTMQSKVTPGLYFAGEILDLDGPIGGFNFQAAFSTGWQAGKAVLREV